MHGAHDFLASLALVLCVAAVTTVLFQKLRQPVVLGYIIAGLIIGPHVPLPLVADAGVVQTLSELGVILLMFALGLEFRLKKLVEVGPTAGITAVVQCSVMLWLGFAVGRVFGWTTMESIFCGAIIAISSTTIIAKAFDEQKIGGRLRELVVGILIVEDLIAILLMTTLTAAATGSGLSAADLALTIGRLAAFLVGTLVVGMLVVPRAMRLVLRMERAETTVVASVGICFAGALLALELGYSVALGAFLAGSLVAESGHGTRIEHITQPVRDIFAAIFFVSVGMLIDPRMVVEHWPPIVVLTVVVIAGKIASVTFGAFLTGAGTRTSVQSGMSLAQIGEFSFIIAGLGLSLDATGSFLYPIAVTVSAVTTLTTPFLIRASSSAASSLDRRMPTRLQTFASLYARWVEKLRAPRATPRTLERRIVRLLVVDAALFTAVVIAAAVFGDDAAHAIHERLALTEATASVVVLAASALFAAPLLYGIVQLSRRLGIALATNILPSGEGGRVDLAAAPRRALVVALQLGSVIAFGAPIVAVTQPFLQGFTGALSFLVVLVGLALLFWRRTTELHGHVRAGAQVLASVLAKSAAGDDESARAPAHHVIEERRVVDAISRGLGEPVSVALAEGANAVGRSLADLELRGRTGATVLVVARGDASFVPGPRDAFAAGDVVVLSGTNDAVDAARALLLSAPLPPASPAGGAIAAEGARHDDSATDGDGASDRENASESEGEGAQPRPAST